jgi:mRNA-degrading endonuclease HigB of HigAB toxin-antitoxin module
MRVISKGKIRSFWLENNKQGRARRSLEQWYDLVKRQSWLKPAQIKSAFGKNVDFVQSDSGNHLAVFNIYANHFRLIAAIHYVPKMPNKGRVYVLRILSHQEYDLNY